MTQIMTTAVVLLWKLVAEPGLLLWAVSVFMDTAFSFTALEWLAAVTILALLRLNVARAVWLGIEEDGA